MLKYHSSEEISDVSEYFNNNWELYQQSVESNLLYHNEMFSALDKFLSDHFKNTPFSIADLGCGDGSAIRDILTNKSLTRYIGIDSASGLIDSAPHIMAKLNCEKRFLCENMATAIKNLEPVNVILSSYALHHLNYAEKVAFIYDCYEKITHHGHLLLIDVVLGDLQQREEWLDDLQQRLIETFPDLTSTEIERRLEHPRNNDFPESIDTYRSIAKMQQWQKFKVLVDKESCAFMVFTK